MLNKIPDSWDYDDSMEMLWLFYQATDELLSETTPDTYTLPLHNALTLIDEMEEVYVLLKEHNIVDKYYIQYIPPIIDEFLSQTEDDSILKKILGLRLESIRTGFSEAQKQSIHFERWLGIFKHSCSRKGYNDCCKETIIELVEHTKNKKQLLDIVKNYYISLLQVGYSREYLYKYSKRFFSNLQNKIHSSKQIESYLEHFDGKNKKFQFLILMNTESIDYIDNISDNIRVNMHIEKISSPKERKELCSEQCVNELFQSYDRRKHNAKRHQKVEVVRYEDMAIDPYAAIKELSDRMQLMQTLKLYFIHFYSEKQIYEILLKSDDRYVVFKVPNKLQKRPYIQPALIDSRVINILSQKAMSLEVSFSVIRAIEMHAEALKSTSQSTLIRTFWTTLETLFLNPDANSGRENVQKSVIAIIQKTYLLKVTRLIYAQLSKSLLKEDLIELEIDTYKKFLIYFVSYKADSEQMKKIYARLDHNILLRSRLYNLRNQLKNGTQIQEFLSSHETRVTWQLKRLYRIRNIATHLGHDAVGLNIAVNHLHSYFDYMVNYMLCKSENGDAITSMSALVLETYNDNRIHHELLKSEEEISTNNYMEYLFGPDTHLVDYIFEY